MFRPCLRKQVAGHNSLDNNLNQVTRLFYTAGFSKSCPEPDSTFRKRRSPRAPSPIFFARALPRSRIPSRATPHKPQCAPRRPLSATAPEVEVRPTGRPLEAIGAGTSRPNETDARAMPRPPRREELENVEFWVWVAGHHVELYDV